MKGTGSRYRTFRIGTRSSPLARAQAAEVVAALRTAGPGVRPEIVTLSTKGDRHKDVPLSSMERGMFVKEINRALLDREIDAAVHSAKDLPAPPLAGVVIAAICERRDPRDALINRWDAGLASLPAGVRLGTGSPRRTALLASVRPDIRVVPIRGNVGTRIAKVGTGDYDGVVVAAAGLQRLGLTARAAEYLDPAVFTPDVGQGALIVQVRDDDAEAARIASLADHAQTRTAVSAERAFLLTIGGGCSVPVAAYASVAEGRLRMNAMASTPDGSQMFRQCLDFDASDPVAGGRALAEKLISAGASAIVGGRA